MSQRAVLPRLIGMLRWFIHRKIAAYEKNYGYDLTYARDVLAIVAGYLAASGQAAIGIQFARGVLAHSSEADEPRAEIQRRWGERAVLSCAYALCAARFFPALKYALGHGHACQKVVVAGTTVQPRAAQLRVAS